MGDPDFRARLMQIVASIRPEMVVADTEAIFAALADDPAASFGPTVCVGYCMGARFALHVAAALPDDFVAAAGIHPGALVTDQTGLAAPRRRIGPSPRTTSRPRPRSSSASATSSNTKT
jgi:dienelactone hydrolase